MRCLAMVLAGALALSGIGPAAAEGASMEQTRPPTGANDPADGMPPAVQARPPRPVQGGIVARRIDGPTPRYPQSEQRRAREGWVEVSFVIRPDGTVADPVVQASSGIAAFEQAALKAVAAQRYAPATVNGKPVEQCAARFRFVFSLTGLPKGASLEFVRRYKAIMKVLEAGSLAEAAGLIAALEQDATNNYENARVALLRAELLRRQGDAPGALAMLQRAGDDDGRFLEPAVYRTVLRMTFAQAVAAEAWGAALDASDRLAGLAEQPADVAAVASRIRAAINGTDLLFTSGMVGYPGGAAEGPANWQHALLRREFGFARIEGQVERFELRCDWRRVLGEVNTSDAWRVPDSWGNCDVFVFGEPGARVRLVEFPPPATAGPEAPPPAAPATTMR